jgi:hypothetical protein
MMALRPGQLIAQAGFANTGFPDDADELPTTLGNLRQDVTQVAQFPLPAYEATQMALPVYCERRAS